MSNEFPSQTADNIYFWCHLYVTFDATTKMIRFHVDIFLVLPYRLLPQCLLLLLIHSNSPLFLFTNKYTKKIRKIIKFHLILASHSIFMFAITIFNEMITHKLINVNNHSVTMDKSGDKSRNGRA